MGPGGCQNGSWVIGVAKAGNEEGVEQIGSSIIVAPSGEIAAACSTTADELAIARCGLDPTLSQKNTTFNFAKHRELQAYAMIVERKGRFLRRDCSAAGGMLGPRSCIELIWRGSIEAIVGSLCRGLGRDRRGL